MRIPVQHPPPPHTHTHNKATDSVTRRIVSLRDRFSEVDLAYLAGTPSPSVDVGLMSALMLHVHILSVDSREHTPPKKNTSNKIPFDGDKRAFYRDNLSVLN